MSGEYRISSGCCAAISVANNLLACDSNTNCVSLVRAEVFHVAFEEPHCEADDDPLLDGRVSVECRISKEEGHLTGTVVPWTSP